MIYGCWFNKDPGKDPVTIVANWRLLCFPQENTCEGNRSESRILTGRLLIGQMKLQALQSSSHWKWRGNLPRWYFTSCLSIFGDTAERWESFRKNASQTTQQECLSLGAGTCLKNWKEMRVLTLRTLAYTWANCWVSFPRTLNAVPSFLSPAESRQDKYFPVPRFCRRNPRTMCLFTRACCWDHQ